MNNDAAAIIEIRQGKQEDAEFILATWLRGVYYGCPWFKEIDKDIFMKNYHIVVSNIIGRSNVYVAVLKEDPDIITGYSVIEDSDKLHWVYVKEAWRRVGIADSLTSPSSLTTCTHLTILGKRLKPKSMIFNPFLI